LAPDHSRDFDELLKYADTALQNAKRVGKNTYWLFDESMKSDEAESVRLRTQLRSA